MGRNTGDQFSVRSITSGCHQDPSCGGPTTPFTSTQIATMQKAIRHPGFPLMSFPSGCPTRRLSLKRYATRSGSSQQVLLGRNARLLLASTALLSATSGYLLATYASQRSGSTEGTEEVLPPGLESSQYGTAKDFREAIEELKAAFPEPGAVSDDPHVLGPYGFSENDYHPGNPRSFVSTDSY